MVTAPNEQSPRRDVILGRHSKVWAALAAHPRLAQWRHSAIGHRELADFAFDAGDRVWVLSYSREPGRNSALLAHLRGAPACEIVYVSSSSTIVCTVTDCYEYPRVKQRAEREAAALPNGRVLTLGLVYEQETTLPGGLNVATSIDQLAAFLADPAWPDDGGRGKHLFEARQRPFGSALEAGTYRLYGRMQALAGRWPCLLRPVDLLLRALGWRWYGYVFLSNRLWTATTS